MDINFILEYEENGVKHYKTPDEKYRVVVRTDGKILLYKLNEQDDCYDWTESYYETFDECISIIKQEAVNIQGE